MNLLSSLTQSQSLKLNITPQLKQSIYLLQISADELTDYLQKQVEENPLLDIQWYSVDRTHKLKRTTSFAGNHRQQQFLQNIGKPGDTLEMILLSQLRLNRITEPHLRIAQYLAGNLNDDGYLRISLDEVCSACGADMEEVRAALACLQSLEPAGIGARSLQECLHLQICRDPNANPWAGQIVEKYLQELGSNRIKHVAENLHISLETTRQACEYIRRLHPRPGLLYNQQPQAYIQADAFVKSERGEYIIELNDLLTPKVAVNQEYLRLIARYADPVARDFLKSHFQAAKWLLRGLDQRKSTIYRVVEAIVAEQKSFFDHGVRCLKPLNLKDIAGKLNLHESTISRATQNKYVQTPHGLFELKFFFATGLSTHDGMETSPESIKTRIKHLIEHENKQCPLSDQNIADVLVRDGLQISRRTVMKYREELHILSSRLRRSG